MATNLQVGADGTHPFSLQPGRLLDNPGLVPPEDEDRQRPNHVADSVYLELCDGYADGETGYGLDDHPPRLKAADDLLGAVGLAFVDDLIAGDVGQQPALCKEHDRPRRQIETCPARDERRAVRHVRRIRVDNEATHTGVEGVHHSPLLSGNHLICGNPVLQHSSVEFIERITGHFHTSGSEPCRALILFARARADMCCRQAVQMTNSGPNIPSKLHLRYRQVCSRLLSVGLGRFRWTVDHTHSTKVKMQENRRDSVPRPSGPETKPTSVV